jgi:hypothetical protein
MGAQKLISAVGVGNCLVQVPFNFQYFRGRYNEFADRYLIARYDGADALRLQPTHAVNVLSGQPLLKFVPSLYPQPYRVTVRAHEVMTQRLSSTETFATDQQIAGGRLVSVLKVRLTWHFLTGIPVTADFDIGTGLDLPVGPTDTVEVDVLVPDPTSIPDILPTETSDANFNTLVQASVFCDPCANLSWSGRFTQAEFVQTGTSSAIRRVEIKPEARRIQLFSDSTGNMSPRFINLYDFNPAASANFGRLFWDPAEFSSPKYEIPQGATHLELSSAPANPTGARIIAVQEMFR